MKRLSLMIAIVMTCLLTACASTSSGDVYKKSETQKAQKHQTGIVTNVKQVKIEGTSSAVGSSIGSVVGGIAGGSATNSRARTLTAMLGAIAGGILGNYAEQAMTGEDGLEITIALDDGDEPITVVQSADVPFTTGDKVKVVQIGSTYRITH